MMGRSGRILRYLGLVGLLAACRDHDVHAVGGGQAECGS
jgi:hypothetical protein